MKYAKVVKFNEFGFRIGESHGRARFTDSEIELMRQLLDGGMSPRDVATTMECSVRYVYKVWRCERRASTVRKALPLPCASED